MKQFYIRDGRAPLPRRESTSRVMSANKPRDTGPELSLRRALWKKGIRGYRVNWRKAPGRPDVAFPARKIAVFVNGCFWHRCPYCQPSLPNSHKRFWQQKFRNNVRRDKIKVQQLRRVGWKVVTSWECRLERNPQSTVNQIEKLLLTRNRGINE